MSIRRDDFSWKISQISEVLEALGRASKLYPKPKDLPPLPKPLIKSDIEQISRWLNNAAGLLALEIEPVSARYEEVEQFLCKSAPAIILLPQEDELSNEEKEIIVLVKGGKSRVSLLCPHLGVKRVATSYIRDLLCFPLEKPISDQMEVLLMEAGIPKERRIVVNKAILKEQLASYNVIEGWLLRPSPSDAFWKLLFHAKIPLYLWRMFSAYGVQQFLSIFAWWMIGLGVFQGHFEWAWLLAWALVMLTAIPFQLMMVEAQSLLAVHSGAVFKQRLLFGVLRLEPEEIRHQGAGQFLGRVMESSAVESLALSGGLSAVLAVIQLIAAIWILAQGAGGIYHSLLLVLWLLFTAFLGWRMIEHSYHWTNTYREMTNDLVESMVGHRTKLAQQQIEKWHEEEDAQLSRYITQTIQQNRINMYVTFIPRGWLIVGLSFITIPMIAAPQASQIIAVSLGGVILASQAFQMLIEGLQSIVGFILALQQVKPIFDAASRQRLISPFFFNVNDRSDKIEHGSSSTLLIGREINYRYQQHGRYVLNNLSFEINQGDRILLEGPSGGGKSTLAAVLAGLRQPESGLLLYYGFDQKTIGIEEWHRQIVSAPQFQENHVFNETFAFNLLMGRRWPPLPVDLKDAEEICRELGLGELIDRMPAGFQQMVGESGWQLSHGERSRLYIARALLQGAEIIILDESFGALDPENLARALRCVLNRSKTLIVIAHP